MEIKDTSYYKIEYRSKERIESISLKGSWDNWAQPVSMHHCEDGDIYYGFAPLSPGLDKITFKFIINGTWLTAPQYSTEIDGVGNTNNIVCIKRLSSKSPFPYMRVSFRQVNVVHGLDGLLREDARQSEHASDAAKTSGALLRDGQTDIVTPEIDHGKSKLVLSNYLYEIGL
jgi:hypothetical protein